MPNPFSDRSMAHAPPLGVEIAGEFYAGGETLHPADLSVLRPEEIKGLLKASISDPSQAQQAYLRAASPRKDEAPRRVGGRRERPYDDPPVEAPAVPGKATARPTTAEEGRAFLPEQVRGDVSDREALKLTRRGAEEFVEVFNRLPSDFEVATAARLGQAKRGWYRDAANSILYLFGPDAPRFTALLAATSPVKSVQDNLRNALAIWEHYNRYRASLGREPTRRELQAELGRMGESLSAYGHRSVAMETEIPNVTRALTKPGTSPETLSGPKVDSFRANLLHDLHEVTNDTWMAALYGLQQKDIEGRNSPDKHGGRQVISPAYAAASAKARRAANLLNKGLTEADIANGARPWTPAEVQETTWSVFRALAYLQGNARRGAKRQEPTVAGRDVPTGPEALDLLTHELVANNSDFVTLLLSDDYARHKVEQLGLGRGLETLAAVHEAAKAERGSPRGRAVESLQGDPQALEAATTVARRAGTRSQSFESATAKLRREGRAASGSHGKTYHRSRKKYSGLMDLYSLGRGAYQEGGEGRAIRRAARSQPAGSHHEIQRGVHHIHGPGGRTIQVHHDLPSGAAHLGFLQPGLADHEAAPDLQPGTIAFLRQLQDLLHALREEQVPVYYVPADQQRRGIYEAAMRRAGYERNRIYDLDGGHGWSPTGAPSRKLSRRRKLARSPAPPTPLPGTLAAPPQAAVFASGSTEEGLGFDQALKRASSGNQKAFLQMTDERMTQIGLKGRSVSAVGDWEDGAEHSVVREVGPETDFDTLKYAAAWYGLLGNQRSVLVFKPGQSGADSTYTVRVPETNVGKVREQLSAAGVPFRTLVPGRGHTQVIIYDQGRRWRDRVASFAGKHRAVVHESVGVGEYVGGGSRAAARKTYRDIITAYEAARQPRGGGAVRPDQAEGPDRGRGSAPPASQAG